MTKNIIKLNIGCGTDYREGFINVDGSPTLYKVDRVIDLNGSSLQEHFDSNSVDHILANDIVEHFFHWEAEKLLRAFHVILKPTGTCEIRVPDTEYIIKSWRLPLETKLNLLYGGQDMPQGDNHAMNDSRKKFPQFFCHKFGWTRESMSKVLKDIGFVDIKTARASVNFIATAKKA